MTTCKPNAGRSRAKHSPNAPTAPSVAAGDTARGAPQVPPTDADQTDAFFRSIAEKLGIHPAEVALLRYGHGGWNPGTNPEKRIRENLMLDQGLQCPLGAALTLGGLLTPEEGEWIDRGLRPMRLELQAWDGVPAELQAWDGVPAELQAWDGVPELRVEDGDGEAYYINPVQFAWRSEEASPWWGFSCDQGDEVPTWMRFFVEPVPAPDSYRARGQDPLAAADLATEAPQQAERSPEAVESGEGVAEALRLLGGAEPAPIWDVRTARPPLGRMNSYAARALGRHLCGLDRELLDPRDAAALDPERADLLADVFAVTLVACMVAVNAQPSAAACPPGRPLPPPAEDLWERTFGNDPLARVDAALQELMAIVAAAPTVEVLDAIEQRIREDVEPDLLVFLAQRRAQRQQMGGAACRK